MGKSASKKAESSLGASADRFAALQEKLESESAPQRQQVGQYFSDIISGDRQKATRALAPQIEATRAQFGQAGKAIERNLPRGGVQQQARSDVAQAEAGAVGNLYTGGVNEALARLAALSTFGTQAGISAGGQGVGAGTSLAELGASQNAAAMGALGSDAAIEAADVVLMDDNVSKIPTAIRIGRQPPRIPGSRSRRRRIMRHQHL